MGRRSPAFVIVLACVLVLAGCGSPTGRNDTTAPTEARSSTAPSTAADTPALVVTERVTIAAAPDGEGVSPDVSVTLIKNVTLVEGRDANGDRGSGTFALRIRADTSVPTADGTGDPGDPYFTIAINGAQEFTTAEVERTTDGTFTIPYPVARSKSNHQTERSGLNLDSISSVGETVEWFLIEMAESADKSA